MQKVLTLLYHRVADLKYDKNLLAVTPENFRDQMAYLKKNYSIVGFEQDWNEVEGDAVCITFDDGYMDNFTNALPVLQEFEIPATVFVSTGNMNTSEEFWWDELERLLLEEEGGYEKSFTLSDEIFSCCLPTETIAEREELYDTLHWLMYDKITVGRRNDWFDQMRKWRKTDKEGRIQNRAIQTDSADIFSPWMSIGAHTVNHPSLKTLSEQEQDYEISQSVKALEALLGREITVFSYPFGTIRDFDQTTIDICRKAHIVKAAANIPGIWTSGCDDYRIPRNLVRNWEIKEYINRVEAFWRAE